MRAYLIYLCNNSCSLLQGDGDPLSRFPNFPSCRARWPAKTRVFLHQSRLSLASPGVASVLEKAVRACFGAASAPPVRSKLLLRPALVPHAHSKRLLELPPVCPKKLFEPADSDHFSKNVIVSVTLCSAPPCCALLAPRKDMHGFTLVPIYIYMYGFVHFCIRSIYLFYNF